MSFLDVYRHNQLVFPSRVFSRRKATPDLKHLKGPVRAHLEGWRAFRLSNTFQTHRVLIPSEYLNTVSGSDKWDGEELHVPR